jgi:phosphatidate phosphatase PAH1
MPAIDIIATRQPDGTIKSSPFYVRFSKRVKKRRFIQVIVNGRQVQQMDQQLVIESYDKYVGFHNLTNTNTEHLYAPGASFRLDPVHVSLWKKIWLGNLPSHKMRDLIPSAEFLAQFNLDEDNYIHRIDFTDGTEVVTTRLFFYDWDEKFIISDVDATLPQVHL